MSKIKDESKLKIILQKIPEDEITNDLIDKEVKIIHDIMEIYYEFYNDLYNIDIFFKLNKKLLSSELKKHKQNIKEIINESKEEENDKNIVLSLTNNKAKKFHNMYIDIQTLGMSNIVIPKTMLIYYDTLLENFLRKIFTLIYSIDKDLLNESEIKYSFSDLKSFDSIEQLQNDIISKKVWGILWDPIDKQVEKLCNLLGIKEVETFPIKELIEISLRRNLFTHEDGIVNDIYLKKCNKHQIKSNFQKGHKIKIEDKYFNDIYYIYNEFLIKTIYFLWLKLSYSHDKFDNVYGGFLNNRAYENIKEKNYIFALKILDFAFKSKFISKTNEETRMFLNINYALAYKLQGNKAKVKDIINSIDWSAKSNKFQLAKSVLLEDWKLASKIMLKILKVDDNTDNETISEKELLTWPLFIEFREQNEFKESFKKIFGKDFTKKI